MISKNADLRSIEQFFNLYPTYAEKKQLICKAWDFLCSVSKDQKRECGEDYTDHPLRTAAILADVKMDDESIICALLHSVLNISGVTSTQIENLFGANVRKIIESSSRITSMHIQNRTLQQADSIRKMLFAMIDDIRVILVKLADRLDRMRNLKHVQPDQQKQISQEVLDIWAPLANRLGMSFVKDEFEDLCLKYINPDVYEQIKHLVMLKKDQRSGYLENAQKEILKATEVAGIKVTISTRAKHFYSIYQKMRKRGKSPEEIYDLLALRIICDTTTECYTLIGIVHNLWKPLEGRFKDYIAMPKANGYQSLHTTVLCDGMPLEIQIRTTEMHSVAEHGVASHWLYKKGTNRDNVDLENLSIINQLKQLKLENGNDAALFEEIKDELLGDSIFVFTPKGDVRELPAGSTAIDFAYSIHSHIGETIVGAKADGHIIPLSSSLKNTQIIEILTNPQAHPNVNQLHSVKTQRARSKIKSWLLQNEPELKLEQPVEQQQIPVVEQETKQVHTVQQVPEQETIRIKIGDTTNFMVNVAHCCNPVYGDAIVGYVSRGRGLIIHKEKCTNFLRIPNITERTVHVIWDDMPVTIQKTNKKKK